VYVDGKLRAFGGSGDSGKKFIPISWEPVSYPAFIVGADAVEGQRPWQGALDEFKIFSRPLTINEARAEYGRFCKVPAAVDALDPYLWAGAEETLTLSFENQKGSDVQTRASYGVKDAAGAVVAQGELGALKRYLEKAKACLAGKEYARLYFLLQEAWAYTLRQP